MSAANQISREELLRDAGNAILAEHIRTRLAQTGRVLAKGSPESQARWFISRWSTTNIEVFCLLAKTTDRFLSHKVIAAAVGSTPKACRDFWSKTLRGMKVRTRIVDTRECATISLFRRTREMTYSSSGIKLQVRTEMLGVRLARLAIETTRGAVVAGMQNHEGACVALEAQSEEVSATTARDLLQSAVEEPVVQKKQGNLFK